LRDARPVLVSGVLDGQFPGDDGVEESASACGPTWVWAR
jgi:hypothetical protein